MATDRSRDSRKNISRLTGIDAHQDRLQSVILAPLIALSRQLVADKVGELLEIEGKAVWLSALENCRCYRGRAMHAFESVDYNRRADARR